MSEKFEHTVVGPEINESRLDSLRSNNESLRVELEHLRKIFLDGFSETAFDYIQEKAASAFMDRWLSRIEAETTLLNNVHTMGIRLFVADLDKQPNLPFKKYSRESSIIFNSDFDGVHTDKPHVQGLAERGGKIKLKGTIPTQKQQLQYFVTNGKLHPTVYCMVHELIHHYHHDQNLETDELLSEGQAYASGLVEAMPYDSIDEMADHMVKDYGFKKERVISVLTNILFLYSQDLGTRAVANIVRSMNPALQAHWALEKFGVEPILESKGITEDEKEEWVKNYLLKNAVERVRAQNIFLQVFGQWMME